MSNLVVINAGQELAPVNQDAVDVLESVLEDFKSGKFTSFGMVCLDKQGNALECIWDTDGDVLQLMGGVVRLNYRLNETLSEQA